MSLLVFASDSNTLAAFPLAVIPMGEDFQSIRKHARQAQPRAVPHVTRRPRADAAAERGRKRLPCSARVSGAGSNSRAASDHLTPLTRTGRLRCGRTSCHLRSRNRFIFQTKNFVHIATGAPSARTVLLARRANCAAKEHVRRASCLARRPAALPFRCRGHFLHACSRQLSPTESFRNESAASGVGGGSVKHHVPR